jgi:hypothetical protein
LITVRLRKVEIVHLLNAEFQINNILHYVVAAAHRKVVLDDYYQPTERQQVTGASNFEFQIRNIPYRGVAAEHADIKSSVMLNFES